ncbi:uncharacterized protein LOC123918518 isoform X1 [Trifolium pratense]|uniref:Uncharacterized protein n=1 Tax=Trifolium pratense TaxID=57577 RepID=A0ACB0MDV4_TRIPR|nr:uncharacterized protein LOC123918518 isoform X1 [Trifolium pratense]CAJ2678785.1 unnamed protein product [Trifolium pratense]
MSESCGSNAFPNAEVEKQITNKKCTRDVEDEVLSTTQKPYKLIKMTEPSHWPETQNLNMDSQPVQETEFTQELYEESPWQETLKLNLDSKVRFGGRHAVEGNMDFVRSFTIRADLNDTDLVSDILNTAKQNKLMMDIDQYCSEMEGLTIAAQINKIARRERVNGREVREILNFLRFEFKEYCQQMGRGAEGLIFNFATGTFTSNGRVKLSEAKLKDLTTNIASKHEHAIGYFFLLKDICPNILCKYRNSNDLKRQSHNSRSLSLTGAASSSGKRKSSSNDTFTSVKKPVSIKKMLNGYDNRPSDLNSLAKRMESIFHPQKSMGIINKLLDCFKGHPYLVDLFSEYDDTKFKNEIIRLKQMNLDGGASSEC